MTEARAAWVTFTWYTTTTFSLDQFGTPVTVTAPPADQITRSPTVTAKESA